MEMKRNSQKGFTLMELLITIVIIGILAAIAVPSYLSYTKKAYYSEVVRATAPLKVAVAECYHTTGDLTQCAGGSNGVPADVTTATGGVASLTTAAGGVITATPVAQHGIASTEDYILTPSIVNNEMLWTSSGGGVTSGLAK
ncbi:MAG: pilA [Gammaproteobacteria bacterium]|jgi:type IV pilus assembly protein PilA|nr:pilA [Gammaproteobacteria bacterium]